MAQRHTVSHLGGVDTQLENLDPLLQINQEHFRRRVVDYQRTAFSSRIEDLRPLFAVGIRRSGYGQHHTRDGVGQRPVDKLLGDKRLVRDDDLFTVPVADGGGAGVDPGDAAGEIADGHRIANSNRLFKQNDQTRNEVGKNLL